MRGYGYFTSSVRRALYEEQNNLKAKHLTIVNTLRYFYTAIIESGKHAVSLL